MSSSHPYRFDASVVSLRLFLEGVDCHSTNDDDFVSDSAPRIAAAAEIHR